MSVQQLFQKFKFLAFERRRVEQRDVLQTSAADDALPQDHFHRNGEMAGKRYKEAGAAVQQVHFRRQTIHLLANSNKDGAEIFAQRFLFVLGEKPESAIHALLIFDVGKGGREVGEMRGDEKRLVERVAVVLMGENERHAVHRLLQHDSVPRVCERGHQTPALFRLMFVQALYDVEGAFHYEVIFVAGEKRNNKREYFCGVRLADDLRQEVQFFNFQLVHVIRLRTKAVQVVVNGRKSFNVLIRLANLYNNFQ